MKTAIPFKRPQVGQVYRTSAKHPRGELVRRHQPSRVSAKPSPFAADLARLRSDLREASTHGRRAARAYADADADRKSALADFLRACDAGDRVGADALLVKHREAELELRVAERGLTAVHSRLDRLAGELVSIERFV